MKPHVAMAAPSAAALLAGTLVGLSAGAGAESEVALTYQRLDGNRVIDGVGPGARARAVDVDLPGRPAWVLAHAAGSDVHWLVVLADGRLAHVSVGKDGAVRSARPGVARLPPGMPPVALAGPTGLEPLVPGSDASPWTHPVPHREGLIRVTAGGRLASDSQAGPEVLPDARLLLRGDRLLVLAGPTRAYGHGVLGDSIEAREALLLDAGTFARVARIGPRGDGSRVIEGLAPIWADLDGDGQPEIIVTASDQRAGARLAVYAESGEWLAASTPIGRGYRWRHQIGVARTAPGGPPELVSVRTPHLGGVVEFFRLEGERLVLGARHPGVSSHVLGSRNLDMAALADWDGDGGMDVLVPTLTHDALLVVARTPEGATERARLEAGARIATNVAGAAAPGAPLHVGVGTVDGRLRLWGALYTLAE